jgi:hypothetical protein
MALIAFIGIGAGAAAALLFASLASGAPMSAFLLCLAPLPIMLAGLGWTHWAGLLAALAGAAGLGVAFGGFSLAVFLVSIGGPAWWLAYLALLARPSADPDPQALDWYPVGRLVLWAVLLAGIVVIVGLLSLATDADTLRATVRAGWERFLRLRADVPAETPSGLPSGNDADVVDFLVAAAPPVFAVFFSVIFVSNLWLAALICRVSGRLRRPWPQLADTAMPGPTPVFLAVALAASFLPDLPGILARVIASSLFMAYALLGLAVLHALTKGIPARPFILAGVWCAVVNLWPICWPILTLLGLADSVMGLRGRVINRPGPPTIRT